MKRNVFMLKHLCVALFVVFIFSSCSSRTPQELQAQPKIYKKYTVKNGYQSVFKGIDEKWSECFNNILFRDSKMYTDLKEGQLLFRGDFNSVHMYVVVKEIGQQLSEVEVFAASASFGWPDRVEAIRRGAYGEMGCP